MKSIKIPQKNNSRIKERKERQRVKSIEEKSHRDKRRK